MTFWNRRNSQGLQCLLTIAGDVVSPMGNQQDVVNLALI